MKRAIGFGLVFVFALISAACSAAPSQEHRAATLAYVHSLQNPDGGYRPTAAAAPSSIGSTSSALRAIKYMGGQPGNRDGIVEFLVSRYDDSKGACSEVPGGPLSVRSTAVGLMAAVEVKIAADELAEPIAKINAYFAENAKSLPDIYIAAAALDSAKTRPLKMAEWIAAYEATRKPDGSYGNAAETAGAVNTILRAGGTVKDPTALLAHLKAAQRPDGGFGAGEAASDLGTTYRVLRAINMLKGKPDLERLNGFVAKCRNADGGYGPAPGQPSAVGPTYFAAIVSHWAEEMAK